MDMVGPPRNICKIRTLKVYENDIFLTSYDGIYMTQLNYDIITWTLISTGCCGKH